ncbi:hypothetical protein [uncultured Sphingomonas sp.]|uniref:hypothetical protein n=1 Tax=uncultured Sphingomonas sp. TaxID=158754 RepID=UPI002617F9B3|nr:hypothetical protein [uncultured Sphingomonas sp.]
MIMMIVNLLVWALLASWAVQLAAAASTAMFLYVRGKVAPAALAPVRAGTTDMTHPG